MVLSLKRPLGRLRRGHSLYVNEITAGQRCSPASLTRKRAGANFEFSLFFKLRAMTSAVCCCCCCCDATALATATTSGFYCTKSGERLPGAVLRGIRKALINKAALLSERGSHNAVGPKPMIVRERLSATCVSYAAASRVAAEWPICCCYLFSNEPLRVHSEPRNKLSDFL